MPEIGFFPVRNKAAAAPNVSLYTESLANIFPLFCSNAAMTWLAIFEVHVCLPGFLSFFISATSFAHLFSTRRAADP
jgi:hypothetical protein